MVMNCLQRTVLWHGIWLPGRDWCQLSPEGEGWRLSGTVLTAVASEPVMVHYDVTVDADWATRQVQVALWTGSRERTLELTIDQKHRWHAERDTNADASDAGVFDGLVDVDLGFSPVTNTLPIRRLAPAVGESVDVT